MARPTLRSLGLENEALRLELHIVRAELAIAKQSKTAPSVRPAFVPRAPTPAQVAAHSAYRAALAASREEAMRTGKSVLVAR
jgi:hypothetical protein